MEKYSILTLCENCGVKFKVWKYNLLKGFGKYCSKGCSNKAKPRGFKKGHGSYWTKESRIKFSEKMGDEKHPKWKGEKAGKGAKHAWIKRNKGEPKECEHCGSRSKKKTYDWANIDHKYRRVLEEYLRLCRSCHRKYDIKNNNYKIF